MCTFIGITRYREYAPAPLTRFTPSQREIFSVSGDTKKCTLDSMKLSSSMFEAYTALARTSNSFLYR